MTAETPARRKRTAREAARLSGYSERHIRRIVAEPRTEYERRGRERRRRVVELRKGGMKYQQIADELGMSMGSVSATLHRARKAGEI